MNNEERAQFKLKPGLGGQSTSFYERIIRKIYGRDNGQEAIVALYDQPAIAVPIILQRMKQKDEEWKRALREWNRIWREIDAKNFYRSLDHQGLTFKGNDKKTTTSKFLVTEIEALRKEDKQKRISLVNPPPAFTGLLPEEEEQETPKEGIFLRPHHQFEMHLPDLAVLYDLLKLAFAYLDRATTPYTSNERIRIEKTLRRLIPLIFTLDQGEVEANLSPVNVFVEDMDAPTLAAEDNENGGTEADGESDDEEAGTALSETASESGMSGVNGSPSASTKRKEKQVKDLRKKLLAAAVGGSALNGKGPDESDAEGDDEMEDADITKRTTDSTQLNDTEEASPKNNGETVTEAPSTSAPANAEEASIPAIDGEDTTPAIPAVEGDEESTTRLSPTPKVTSEAMQTDAGEDHPTASQEASYHFFASQGYYCMIRILHVGRHATYLRLVLPANSKSSFRCFIIAWRRSSRLPTSFPRILLLWTVSVLSLSS